MSKSVEDDTYQTEDENLSSDEVFTPADVERPVRNSDAARLKVYKCDYEGCKAAFPRPWRLAQHLSVHKGQRNFICDEERCTKAYTSMSHLKRHKLTAHAVQHVNPTYLCPMYGCKKVLKTRDTLMKHTKRAHGDKVFNCKVCDQSFITEKKLQCHSKTHHNNQESHRCDKCKMIFPKLGKYHRHLRRHRIHVCPHLNCYYSSEDYVELRRHMAKFHPKLLKCEYCGKELKDKSLLRKHIKAHLASLGLADPPSRGEELKSVTYECALCTSQLTTKGSLKRHILKMHSGVPKERKPVKKGVERARRWDKGIPRQSLASQLSSVRIPSALNQELICKETHSTDDPTSKRVLALMVSGWLDTGLISPDELPHSNSEPPSSS